MNAFKKYWNKKVVIEGKTGLIKGVYIVGSELSVEIFDGEKMIEVFMEDTNALDKIIIK